MGATSCNILDDVDLVRAVANTDGDSDYFEQSKLKVVNGVCLGGFILSMHMSPSDSDHVDIDHFTLLSFVDVENISRSGSRPRDDSDSTIQRQRSWRRFYPLGQPVLSEFDVWMQRVPILLSQLGDRRVRGPQHLGRVDLSESPFC